MFIVPPVAGVFGFFGGLHPLYGDGRAGLVFQDGIGAGLGLFVVTLLLIFILWLTCWIIAEQNAKMSHHNARKVPEDTTPKFTHYIGIVVFGFVGLLWPIDGLDMVFNGKDDDKAAGIFCIILGVLALWGCIHCILIIKRWRQVRQTVEKDRNAAA
jgi:hypothetical protein